MAIENYLTLFIIFTLFVYVLNKLYAKITVKNVDPIALTILGNLFAAIVFLPFVYKDILNFNFDIYQILIIIFGGLCWTVTGLVSNISVKKADVSLREPMLALRVIIVSLLAYLFLQEVFDTQKIIFTFMIFLGVFIAGWRGGKNFDFHSEGSKWVFLSIITMAFSVFFDKLGATQVGVEFYTWCMYFIPFVLQSVKIPSLQKEIKEILTNHRFNFIILSSSMALTYWSQIKLYSLLPISVAYQIIQFGSILTILAAVIFLGERDNLNRRLLGSAIAILGVILFKLI